MKKRAVFSLFLALLLILALLSSCGSRPTPGGTAADPAQPGQTPETPPETPETPETPDPSPTEPAEGALSAPPALTLQADGSTITALLQPDRWSYTTAGGSIAGTSPSCPPGRMRCRWTLPSRRTGSPSAAGTRPAGAFFPLTRWTAPLRERC